MVLVVAARDPELDESVLHARDLRADGRQPLLDDVRSRAGARLLPGHRSVRPDDLVQPRSAAPPGDLGLVGLSALRIRDSLDLGVDHRRLPLRLLELCARAPAGRAPQSHRRLRVAARCAGHAPLPSGRSDTPGPGCPARRARRAPGVHLDRGRGDADRDAGPRSASRLRRRPRHQEAPAVGGASGIRRVRSRRRPRGTTRVLRADRRHTAVVDGCVGVRRRPAEPRRPHGHERLALGHIRLARGSPPRRDQRAGLVPRAARPAHHRAARVTALVAGDPLPPRGVRARDRHVVRNRVARRRAPIALAPVVGAVGGSRGKQHHPVAHRCLRHTGGSCARCDLDLHDGRARVFAPVRAPNTCSGCTHPRVLDDRLRSASRTARLLQRWALQGVHPAWRDAADLPVREHGVVDALAGGIEVLVQHDRGRRGTHYPNAYLDDPTINVLVRDAQATPARQ